MEKDFLIVTPDTGSNDGALNIECTENTDRNQRSSVITVTGNGLASKTINVTQRGDRTTIVSVLGQVTQDYSLLKMARYEAKCSNTYWRFISPNRVIITFPPDKNLYTKYDSEAVQGPGDLFIFRTKNDIPDIIQTGNIVSTFIDLDTNEVIYTPTKTYKVYVNPYPVENGYNMLYIDRVNSEDPSQGEQIYLGDEDLTNINEKLNNKHHWGIRLNTATIIEIENLTYNAQYEVNSELPYS